MNDKFVPKIFFRNPILQSVFGSLKLRNMGSNPMSGCAKETIVDGGKGVRLLGYYSKQPGASSRGTVLFIHGWEGSSRSSYVVSTAKYLYKNKFDIFRLNLRDHGDSHHLNKGLFKSTLIEETFNAVKNVAAMNSKRPFFLVGFSLGGNFALRIALKHRKEKIKNLRHVAAISPVLDPMKSTESTERITVIRKYFIKKWKRSLIKKQALFPETYTFKGLNEMNSLTGMMDTFVPLYTEYKTVNAYYAEYTLLNNVFSNLNIPVTIISSEDDPIIPVQDVYNLRDNKYLQRLVQPYGGHNGFFDFFPYRVWYEEKICKIFGQYSG
ncbi:MAG: alpha/beta fold hydrolase [Spirochaetota bacterium]